MLRIDLSPRYSRELSDSDHTRYGACSEEWSTRGEVTRQKKPDKRYYLHVRSGGHYIILTSGFSSLQQHQGFFSSIGETISSYLLEPLAGKISGYSSNSQEKWRVRYEACCTMK